MLAAEEQNPKIKPSIEVVYAYAVKSTEYHIRENANNLSEEQKEDVKQEAMIRVLEAYDRLDPEKGWKAFIAKHCWGAVLDFLKGGSFEDGLGGISVNEDALKFRVEIKNEDNEVISVENTAAIFGFFTDPSIEERFAPNWDLLSKMAGRDESLMIVAKLLLGFTQEEIAEQRGDDLVDTKSRERVSQIVQELFAKMDSPYFLHDRWINQCIFALGLSKVFNMPEHDNGEGHELPSFNLSDPDSFTKARRWIQPSLFDSPDFQCRPETEKLDNANQRP